MRRLRRLARNPLAGEQVVGDASGVKLRTLVVLVGIFLIASGCASEEPAPEVRYVPIPVPVEQEDSYYEQQQAEAAAKEAACDEIGGQISYIGDCVLPEEDEPTEVYPYDSDDYDPCDLAIKRRLEPECQRDF